MRLVILLLLALLGSLFWATVSFGVLFGVTHDPRFAGDTGFCFGVMIGLAIGLIGLIQYSAVRSVRH